MAIYDKDTKFYWLQLKEDFFEDDAISWLEEQEPNGRDYAYFYLKLCLKSLKTNGILIRNVGNILIPYDNKKLAELTKIDFDTVTVAMELLKRIGLVKILENGEIYVSQLENLIGSQSKGALKKQQQRMISGQKVDKCPPKIEIEIENRNKDIDIDNIVVVDIFSYIEENFGYTISPTTYQNIIDWQKVFNDDIIKYAIDKSCNANARNWNYVDGILKSWKSKGFKTLEECKNEKIKNNKPPEWLNKEIKPNVATDEERKKIEDMLEEYKK